MSADTGNSLGGELYSYLGRYGSLNYSVAEGNAFASPAYANGVIYNTIQSDQLLALRASDGSVLWSAQLGGVDGTSSPAVADGAVFVGDENGVIHAYRLNGSLPAIARPAVRRLQPDRSLRVRPGR